MVRVYLMLWPSTPRMAMRYSADSADGTAMTRLLPGPPNWAVRTTSPLGFSRRICGWDAPGTKLSLTSYSFLAAVLRVTSWYGWLLLLMPSSSVTTPDCLATLTVTSLNFGSVATAIFGTSTEPVRV